MTVTTTRVAGQPAAAGQVGGEQASSSSPVAQRPGVVDGHEPVGVAVEGEAEVARPARRTSAARRSGWVEPTAVVDVGAVGLGRRDHLERAPRRSKTAGATS